MSTAGRRAQRAEMAISERELAALTRELDELHTSTFPQLRKTLDALSGNLGQVVRNPSTRRGFFLGALGAVALGAATACAGGPSDGPDLPSPAVPPPAAPETYPGDLKMVALSAALENLAVTAYGGALKKAGAGELGTVPPATTTFIQTVMKQHADHAQAWNAVLSAAGKPTIDDAPLSITSEQVALHDNAKSVPEVARLALNLENVAAQTYTFATANITDPAGIMTAAGIQPVEAMHAAILNFVLGQYPIPDTFIGVTDALKLDTLTVK